MRRVWPCLKTALFWFVLISEWCAHCFRAAFAREGHHGCQNVQEALRDARQPDRPAVEGVAGGAAVARRPDAGDRRDLEAPGGCRRMSALPSRQAYPSRPGADRRPAVAVPVLQAALFFIDRHGPCPRPFAGPLSSGGLRHVQRSSPFVSPTGQGARSRQDDHPAVAPEDHPRPRWFGCFQPRRLVDVDEKFFRESRKGSREWVRHERDPVSHPKAGPDALDRLQAHGNETVGRHLAVSDSGSHDGGSRWHRARGRSARTTARRR